jgi:hypothetical protein
LEQTNRECPLCHAWGNPLESFGGAYDHDKYHIEFERTFYRCEGSKCGAFFFYDELTRQSDDPNWKEELSQKEEETHAHKQELLDSDVYQSMLRGREENDVTITKDRDLMKQVKEINEEIQRDQENLEGFMNQMRNFSWEDDEAIRKWTASNWLPPSFAEKSLAATFGMSRPLIRKDLPDETRAEMLKDDGPTFRQGQTVLHGAWGKGRVVEGNDDGGTIITAEFPEKGVKKMDLRFAKLEKVS